VERISEVRVLTTKRLVATVLGAQAVGALVQVISGPLLSRLAGPYPFGVFAPVLSVAAIGRLVAESGLTFHVLSAKDLSEEEAHDLHGRSVKLSIFVALIGGLVAALIGSVTVDERVFRGMASALLIVFTGVGAVPIAWIQRNGGLGKLAWLSVGLSAASTALAIPLALLGFNLAAVVSNNILPMTVLPVYTWWISGLYKAGKTTSDLTAGFRWGTLGASAAYFLSSGADGIALATYLDPTTLGVYTRIVLLASLPGQVIATGLASVGQLAMSTRVAHGAQLRYLVKASGLTLAVFSIPLALSMAGLNLPVILFGSKYYVTPLAYEYFTVASALFFVGSLFNTFHQANRRTAQQTAPLLVHSAIAIGGILVFRPTSIERIGLILLIASAVRSVLLGVVSWRDIIGKPRSIEEPAPV